jgi:hypothetical protein
MTGDTPDDVIGIVVETTANPPGTQTATTSETHLQCPDQQGE